MTTTCMPVRAPRVWPGAVVYAGVPLVLANIPGSLAFAVNPDTAADIGMTRVAVPPWVFVVVWAIIHAGIHHGRGAAVGVRRRVGDHPRRHGVGGVAAPPFVH
jgi:hypothetical protein